MSLKSFPFFIIIILGAIINMLGLQTTAQFISDIAPNNQPPIPSINYQPAVSGSYQPPAISPSSLVLIPGIIPNAFTSAAWSIPELQSQLLNNVPGYKAAEKEFYAVDEDLRQIGHPAHATIANIVAQNIAGIEQFNVAILLHFKGQVLQKFLTSEGYQITPDLPQKFADIVRDLARSSGVVNYDSAARAVSKGFADFIQSLGDFKDKAYVAALLFNEEVLAYQKYLKS